jgi:hypothetical protein
MHQPITTAFPNGPLASGRQQAGYREKDGTEAAPEARGRSERSEV